MSAVQPGSQYVFGPSPSPNSDTIHFINSQGQIVSWIDANGKLQGNAAVAGGGNFPSDAD